MQRLLLILTITLLLVGYGASASMAQSTQGGASKGSKTKKDTQTQQISHDSTEARDIVDLLSEKKIAIQTQGSGIDSVTVRVRKLTSSPITLRIPVGTFFVAASQSSQDMVTTAEKTVTLTDNTWQEVSPDAACANRPKNIPGSKDTFRVQRSPHQAELTKLMPVLDKAEVDTPTRQAAVWIVTDNADYADLGILVDSATGFGGSRVILEPEAARAMQICDAAGINITRKAIWRNRQQILRGLQESNVKTWLAQKR